MSLRRSLFAVTFLTAGTIALAAAADSDFGTDEEARALAAELVAYINDNGVDAAVDAINDESTAFGGSPMGVALEVGPIAQAHNKFPEIAGMDFGEMQDLRGNYLFQDFRDAADRGGDYVVNFFPHYETGDEYEYQCFSTWAIEAEEVRVTICR